MAGIIDLLSNNSDDGLALDRLYEIGRITRGNCPDVSEAPEPPTLQPQRLSRRLGTDQIADVVGRYRAGESARSIATELAVAPSALVRLLREKGVTVRNTRVTAEKARLMAREYEAGATMRELESRYGLSHGAVYRALHRVGVQTRPPTPRAKALRKVTAARRRQDLS